MSAVPTVSGGSDGPTASWLLDIDACREAPKFPLSLRSPYTYIWRQIPVLLLAEGKDRSNPPSLEVVDVVDRPPEAYCAACAAHAIVRPRRAVAVAVVWQRDKDDISTRELQDWLVDLAELLLAMDDTFFVLRALAVGEIQITLTLLLSFQTSAADRRCSRVSMRWLSPQIYMEYLIQCRMSPSRILGLTVDRDEGPHHVDDHRGFTQIDLACQRQAQRGAPISYSQSQLLAALSHKQSQDGALRRDPG